ncbi:MAG: methionyl-tRNA formyltransferase [Lachnospiraceae bacterium]|nr:methionyl-tRNA formyltransferase [Lachnospiraceae bacterium]
MNIVFMGTPDFAAVSLEKLIKDGRHNITGVITQPDKPRGRKSELVMPEVKKLALEHGLSVYQPVKVRNAEFVELIKGLNPDLIVVVAYGRILIKEVLDIPRFGCINVHASLLPQLRGCAPIQWAIYNGDKTTGVTIQRMNEGVDTGDILSVNTLDIDYNDTGESLFDKLAVLGADTLIETIGSIEDGTVKPVSQDEEKATYAPMISKDDGLIDFNRSAVMIRNQVRAFNPWPSAYTHLNGKMLKVWECDIIEDDDMDSQIGELIMREDGVYVKTGDGVLRITRLQLEGKKSMSAQEFVRGYR